MENGFPYILFYNIRRILKRKRYKDEVPDNAFILLLKPITTPNPLASTSTHTNCSYPNVTYVGKERGENEDGQGGGWEKGKKEQKKNHLTTYSFSSSSKGISFIKNTNPEEESPESSSLHK
eukprot:TRINITY_DN4659_c1_g3_i1.p1 TRINITY_DN4659_c1_g3~~TRINITY_DN4659_c1_g3_i1.p1  ORF type:complete len:121 (+),score=35.57 TRINITY_DN4659_c1_g3_i1:260-622(+)